jgi:GNAT superfamily N-acetyltransferase
VKEMRIRPIAPDDIEDCGRICYEGFKIVNERHGFPPQFPSVEGGAARVRSMLNGPASFGIVAESESRIAGFAFLTERDPVRAIGPIVIDPSVQSRGIGRRLMEALLERARGANSIRLVQAGFNLQSLSLYASLGFDVKDQLLAMTGRPRRGTEKEYSVRRLEEGDMAECEALHKRILTYSRTNELRDRLAEGSPLVVLHKERVVGYLSSPTRATDNHGVADSDEAMQSLLCGAANLNQDPLSFLLPTRHANLFRWCLGEGLRAVRPMTLMSIGGYSDPRGIYVPSILY